MQVLLFARLRDELGCDQVELSATDAGTIASVRAALIQRWPDKASLLAAGRAMVAVNQSLIQNEQHALQSTDEVAFFPPMTGG